MGISQQAAGAALERDLDRFHHGLSGWYVQRNHPKDRRTKGPPDYLAVGLTDGHALALLFDAKSTRSASWSVHLLKPHQAQAFDAFEAAGGVAGLYLRTADGDAWIAWPDIRWKWRRWYTLGTAATVVRADGFACAGGDWVAAVRVDASTRAARAAVQGVA